MAANTKFAVAIHTAGLLARAGKEPVTSESIAQSVSTNPVVVRRVISLLVKQGLVNVRKGQGGGALLTRAASSITLDEIYAAVQRGPLFQAPSLGARHRCPIGRHVGPVLDNMFLKAEQGMIACLRKVTLADVIKAVGERIRAGCPAESQRKRK